MKNLQPDQQTPQPPETTPLPPETNPTPPEDNPTPPESTPTPQEMPDTSSENVSAIEAQQQTLIAPLVDGKPPSNLPAIEVRTSPGPNNYIATQPTIGAPYDEENDNRLLRFFHPSYHWKGLLFSLTKVNEVCNIDNLSKLSYYSLKGFLHASSVTIVPTAAFLTTNRMLYSTTSIGIINGAAYFIQAAINGALRTYSKLPNINNLTAISPSNFAIVTGIIGINCFNTYCLNETFKDLEFLYPEGLPITHKAFKYLSLFIMAVSIPIPIISCIYSSSIPSAFMLGSLYIGTVIPHIIESIFETQIEQGHALREALNASNDFNHAPAL